MRGRDKTSMLVGGVSLRDRVLAAVGDARPRVVVGGVADVPPGVIFVREEPAGGGPVAAVGAGMDLVGPDVDQVALVAADLPLLSAGAIGTLRAALSTADAALFVDPGGRRQLLCGVWRVEAVRRRLAEIGRADLSGASMRALVDGLDVVEVSWTGDGLPPWFDCDTDDDFRRVREWVAE